VVSYFGENFQFHDRHDLSLRRDVLRMRIFWREEMAEIE
jgi:hypothetical protein